MINKLKWQARSDRTTEVTKILNYRQAHTHIYIYTHTINSL